MKTIKDLKEWLNQFPEETEVLFAKQNKPTGYESWGKVDFVDADLTPLSENFGYGETWEFDNGNWIKDDNPDFGKKTLYLGSKE